MSITRLTFSPDFPTAVAERGTHCRHASAGVQITMS